jgi:hypothetical protein
MYKEIIYIIIIFLIIIGVYLTINNYFLEKFENNINFCGRYTWDKTYGERNCKNSSICKWNTQISRSGDNIGWCGSAGKDRLFDEINDKSSYNS